MADGFWPRLYAKQGLVQPVDYSKFDLSNVFDDFLPPKIQPCCARRAAINMIAAGQLLGRVRLHRQTRTRWRLKIRNP